MLRTKRSFSKKRKCQI